MREVSDKSITRRSLLAAAWVAPIGGLSACAGAGGGSTGGQTAKNEPGSVSTTVGDEDIALKLSYVDDPPTKSLMKGFEKKHSNVKIKGKQTPFGDYVKSIKLSMSSDSPPDIAEYNAGAMRSLVPAGKVLDLDDYAKAYNWDDAFPSSSLEILRSAKSAKTYGTGSLYAVPGALSVVGVFYNKSLVKKAGANADPKTLDEFESALKKVKKSGITPLSVGAQEANGTHLWCALVDSLGDLDAYRAWAYGKDGASIEDSSFVDATKTMYHWMKAGYIPKSANATSSDDAVSHFTSGKNAYIITGNWAADQIEKAMGDNVGFMLLPPADSGQGVAAHGASVAFAISAKAENPDAAAAFLNYLQTDDAAQRQYDDGFMPVNSNSPIKTKKSGLKATIAADFKHVVDGRGIMPFPDVAAPGMLDKLQSGIQGVLGAKMSAQKYLKSLQEEWSSYHD